MEKHEENIYETVDDQRYSEIVRERIEDDWIVDDEGFGYAEDGREIFDDFDDNADPQLMRKHKAKKKRLNPDIRPDSSENFSKPKDIRDMFSAHSSALKSKPKSVTSQKNTHSAPDPNIDDLIAELEHEIPSDSL
ncbi:unnamed protein product, partial [Protopolystoma xenopodis]